MSRVRGASRFGLASLLVFASATALALAHASMPWGIVAVAAALTGMCCYVVYETAACPACGSQFFVTGDVSDPRFTRRGDLMAKRCVHCGEPFDAEAS